MRRRAMFLVTSFVLATGGVTFAQMAPTPKKGPEMSMPAADDCQAVAVSEPTRVFVLAEMRGMLASVQGVTEAIARRDWQAAIDAAGKTGLKAFEGMPKPIMMELPEDFRIMGRETHMAFDEVAKSGAMIKRAWVLRYEQLPPRISRRAELGYGVEGGRAE